jgi:hypothetical protein
LLRIILDYGGQLIAAEVSTRIVNLGLLRFLYLVGLGNRDGVSVSIALCTMGKMLDDGIFPLLE